MLFIKAAINSNYVSLYKFPFWTHYNFSLCKFFTSAVIQDSSKYSNCSVVSMVLILLLISSSSSLFSRFWETVPSVPTKISIIITFEFYNFSAVRKGKNICWYFYFSLFSLCCLLEWWTLLDDNFFLLVNSGKIWSSDLDWKIYLYLQIPGNFVHHIFLDRFWFVHILFEKVQFLIQRIIFQLTHNCSAISFVIDWFNYYHHFTLYKFFLPILTSCLSLNCQQVSSDLQESPTYLNNFNNIVVLMVLVFALISNSPSFFQLFGVYSKDTNNKWYPYLPNPSAQAGYDTRSIFKQSLTGLNSEFSFS